MPAVVGDMEQLSGGAEETYSPIALEAGAEANSNDSDRTSSSSPEPVDFYSNIKEHIYLAGPAFCSAVMRKSVDLVSVIAVGHLGAHYLAAAGLASVTANVTGNSLIIGLGGAVSTLGSQAYGAGDMKELSLTLQRSFIIMSLFVCIPVSVLWLFSEPIMQSLGQSYAISEDAHRYLMLLMPGLWALMISMSVQNWLYAQANTVAIAKITLLVALLHPLWVYFYIVVLDAGYVGAAMAVSTTKVSEVFLLMLYLRVFSTALQDTRFQWSRECWWNWGPFLRVGLPSLLMLSEWWASEIIIFMSGSLHDPQTQVSAMSIYQNLLAMCFMLPVGFRAAASTIVGNALGAGQAAVARSSSFVAPGMSLLFMLLITGSILPVRNQICHIFTDDVPVCEVVTSVMPILGVYIVIDGLQTTLTGVLTGMGRQMVGAPVVIFSYYAIGIPVAAFLAMRWGMNWGVFGLCMGTLIGTVMHFSCFAGLIYGFTDWNKEVIRVQLRMKQDAGTQLPTSGSDVSKAAAATDEEDNSWWDELSFDFSTETSSQQTQSSWNRFKQLLGIKLLPTEYELVRTYTDSLSPLHMNDPDEDEEDQHENGEEANYIGGGVFTALYGKQRPKQKSTTSRRRRTEDIDFDFI